MNLEKGKVESTEEKTEAQGKGKEGIKEVSSNETISKQSPKKIKK
jgi:hypothetical protein